MFNGGKLVFEICDLVIPTKLTSMSIFVRSAWSWLKDFEGELTL